MKLPKTYFGKSIEGALDKYLEGAKNPQNGNDQEQDGQTSSLEGVDEGDFVYLPKNRLYVSKERRHLNKNWFDAHKALHNEGYRMLTLSEFVDFLNALRNGTEELKTIYDDITEVRDPVRGEWIDADFKVVNSQLQMNYNHRIVDGELKPHTSGPLTNYLATNKTPGISLDEWLSKPTSEGLPRANIRDGNLYYWALGKDNNSVARFSADSDGANLDCDWIPQYSNSRLGVRVAKIKV